MKLNEVSICRYTLNSLMHEVERLRRENRAALEKLWLVENLLELRHLKGPNQNGTPDPLEELRRSLHKIEHSAEVGHE